MNDNALAIVIYGRDKWEHITGKDLSNIKDSVPAPSWSRKAIAIAKCGDAIKELDDI